MRTWSLRKGGPRPQLAALQGVCTRFPLVWKICGQRAARTTKQFLKWKKPGRSRVKDTSPEDCMVAFRASVKVGFLVVHGQEARLPSSRKEHPWLSEAPEPGDRPTEARGTSSLPSNFRSLSTIRFPGAFSTLWHSLLSKFPLFLGFGPLAVLCTVDFLFGFFCVGVGDTSGDF